MRIYAIPGLGTNEKIFDQVSLPGHEFIILKWPEPVFKYTMRDYAKCFLPQIKTDEPFILLGLSLGGMLAVELSHILHPQKTILISSVKSSNDIPRWIRAQRVIPAYLILPDPLMRFISKCGRRVLGVMDSYYAELAGMIKSMPPGYFRCTIHYIVTWKNNKIPANCILIHGSDDKLLFLRKDKTDYIIEGGSHAMILNRAGEINEILNRVCV